MAEENPKGIDPRIHRFAESAESAQEGSSGMLCLTCGSTAVDHSRSELAYAACGTAVP